MSRRAVVVLAGAGLICPCGCAEAEDVTRGSDVATIDEPAWSGDGVSVTSDVSRVCRAHTPTAADTVI